MPEIGKKLSELRVCDLKDELEKRDLDTVGSKAALLERLQTALKGEGIDPNTYVYQPAGKSAKKSLTKPVDEVLVKEEPIDYDTSAVDDEEANGDYRHGDDDHLIDEVGTVDDECVIIEDDDEYYDNGDEQAAEEDEEEVEAEAEAEDEEVEDEENTGDGTNQDNEESINLTIGEEEQKLLHDEAPDDKERSAADEQAKAVRKESNGKADEDKSEHSGKDDKKEGKDDEGSKIKSKKDEQSNDRKDDSSDQKSSSKTSHKDEKEKSAAVTSNAVATNAAGEVSKSTTGAKSASLSRNLWVSGLSSLTRASDLKTIFSKYGKVIGAKVVTNTRTPGTRCYGYVTMSSSGDASRCIEHLHRTELHGRIISVERTKNEIGGSASSAANAGNRSANNTNSGSKKRDDDKRTSKTSGDDKKKAEDKKSSTHGSKKDDRKDDKSKKDEKDKENKTDSKEAGKDKDDKDREVASTGKRHSRRGSRSVDGARPDRSRDHDREREQRQKERERERERIRQREILSYQKIREERERQRLREKERELREEERRRREIRERQRQEEQRLADERKKLALERERLEKEKAELLRLERERQKLEREKIELERLELKRQQMKIIQSRDDPIKRTVKRSATDDRYAEVPERKRTSGNENRFEAPPPPRFDAALVSSRSYDKKREDYTGSTSTKRGIDDYTSKRSDYASKRDEYTSSTTKRAAVDDYAPAPPKRSTEEYSKRTTSDYIASSGSKRGIDDYSSSNKRDDYSSSKLQRDEYKREVEIRHITASGTSGGGSSYMHKSSGSRYAEPDVQVRSSVTSFRRVDDRGDTRSGTGGKRYDGSGGYGSSSNGAWAPSSSSHLGHVSGVPTIKSYVSNGMSSNVHSGSAAWQKSSAATESNWRSMTSSQDRYDRTYNERSGAYVDSSRPSGGGLYGSGRPTSDRYGGAVSSRYDGKY